MEYSSLEKSYRHIHHLLNEALKKYHPDHAGNNEQNHNFTRLLIKAKEKVDRVYKQLKRGGRHAL